MFLLVFLSIPSALLLYAFDKSLFSVAAIIYIIFIYTQKSARDFVRRSGFISKENVTDDYVSEAKPQAHKVKEEMTKESPTWEAHIDPAPNMKTHYTGRPSSHYEAPKERVARPERRREPRVEAKVYNIRRTVSNVRPNFNGKPHEVLAVTEDADTSIILKSFRYLLKQYHPDHHTGQKLSAYTERTRRLNEAKKAMLESRKSRFTKAA